MSAHCVLKGRWLTWWMGEGFGVEGMGSGPKSFSYWGEELDPICLTPASAPTLRCMSLALGNVPTTTCGLTSSFKLLYVTSSLCLLGFASVVSFV